MAKTSNGVARRESIDAVRARYRVSTRAEQRLMLREFSAIAGVRQPPGNFTPAGSRVLTALGLAPAPWARGPAPCRSSFTP
jgi:hypothetical protein